MQQEGLILLELQRLKLVNGQQHRSVIGLLFYQGKMVQVTAKSYFLSNLIPPALPELVMLQLKMTHSMSTRNKGTYII